MARSLGYEGHIGVGRWDFMAAATSRQRARLSCTALNISGVELDEFVRSFSHGMKVADGLGLRAASQRRTGKLYQPGIGPHSERETIRLSLTRGQSTATIPAGVHVSIVSCRSTMSVISPCISDTKS